MEGKNIFKNRIFPKRKKGKGLRSILGQVSNHEQLKILTPKQMLQILPLALVQVEAGNTSKNLLNEIRKIIYSLYRDKEVTKKVYNNVMNSINV